MLAMVPAFLAVGDPNAAWIRTLSISHPRPRASCLHGCSSRRYPGGKRRSPQHSSSARSSSSAASPAASSASACSCTARSRVGRGAAVDAGDRVSARVSGAWVPARRAAAGPGRGRGRGRGARRAFLARARACRNSARTCGRVRGCSAWRFPGACARQSPTLDSARLCAMEVSRAGRGEGPTHRNTARHLEVGRAGRGEVPTQRRAALRAWKFAALGRAKSAPKRWTAGEPDAGGPAPRLVSMAIENVPLVATENVPLGGG